MVWWYDSCFGRSSWIQEAPRSCFLFSPSNLLSQLSSSYLGCLIAFLVRNRALNLIFSRYLWRHKFLLASSQSAWMNASLRSLFSSTTWKRSLEKLQNLCHYFLEAINMIAFLCTGQSLKGKRLKVKVTVAGDRRDWQITKPTCIVRLMPQQSIDYYRITHRGKKMNALPYFFWVGSNVWPQAGTRDAFW